MSRPRRVLVRLAHGTGLAQLRTVRRRVHRLEEDLREHAVLQRGLAEEVTGLEGLVRQAAGQRR